MTPRNPTIYFLALSIAAWPATLLVAQDTRLPGTDELTIKGDIASQLLDGVDRFLDHEIERTAAVREKLWKRDFSSSVAYVKSIAPNRARLAHILGVRDERIAFESPDLVSTVNRPAIVGRGAAYEIFAIRWPAFGDVHGEGLLLVPTGDVAANVIAIPDADQTPEQLVGLAEGISADSQFARRLAEQGCRVVIPSLINRRVGDVKVPGIDRAKEISNREFLYRSAYQLGRGVGGYEIQKVLAVVDWFEKSDAKPLPVGVFGYGEGGRLALYASALDDRISTAAVSGYFDIRDRLWQEPIDRNVFGLLEQFGDAELAAMIAPRKLIVEATKAPNVILSGKGGGAPAQISTPAIENVKTEFARAVGLVASLKPQFELVVSGDGNGPFGTAEVIDQFLAMLQVTPRSKSEVNLPKALSSQDDHAVRDVRQMHEIDRHNQHLLANAPKVREQFIHKLAMSDSQTLAENAKPFRQLFFDEVIGRFPNVLLPPAPRTRPVEQSERWSRYEVVLDVLPDVIAYGLLTIPKNIPTGEKRAVVVCQHGLEGRPQDVIGDKNAQYYEAFATRLAERGYITFAPQNLYLLEDRFRTLQRKANPIKRSLFSIIVPQHQQIVNWLKTLPQVNGERIAFYGLSYGGKSAMRIPPLVDGYCLSICSADFNDWIVKTTSSREPFSYVWTREYEIYEFDLANTFNYAEMAMLIAPRPFMVERGHFDAVGTDEFVASEFAKIFRFYHTRLHQPDRCAIEWFDGPHKINGVRTFEFLDQHLR